MGTQATGQDRALLFDDQRKDRGQRQQLVQRVAGDQAERVVDVERALAVDDQEPFANLALRFEQRLEQLGPAPEDIFEPLARKRAQDLPRVAGFAPSQVHAAVSLRAACKNSSTATRAQRADALAAHDTYDAPLAFE